jgi:hypothetical protein
MLSATGPGSEISENQLTRRAKQGHNGIIAKSGTRECKACRIAQLRQTGAAVPARLIYIKLIDP